MREVGGERERETERASIQSIAQILNKNKNISMRHRNKIKSQLIVETLLRFLLCFFPTKSSFNAKKEKT